MEAQSQGYIYNTIVREGVWGFRWGKNEEGERKNESQVGGGGDDQNAQYIPLPGVSAKTKFIFIKIVLVRNRGNLFRIWNKKRSSRPKLVTIDIRMKVSPK